MKDVIGEMKATHKNLEEENKEEDEKNIKEGEERLEKLIRGLRVEYGMSDQINRKGSKRSEVSKSPSTNKDDKTNMESSSMKHEVTALESPPADVLNGANVNGNISKRNSAAGNGEKDEPEVFTKRTEVEVNQLKIKEKNELLDEDVKRLEKVNFRQRVIEVYGSKYYKKNDILKVIFPNSIDWFRDAANELHNNGKNFIVRESRNLLIRMITGKVEEVDREETVKQMLRNS
jgi:hypothetical protein